MADTPIHTDRMLRLMDWALGNGIASTETEYLGLIGFARTNISNVRRGLQHFTRDHIMAACQLTGANANWIFGLERNMMRAKSKDPISKIREALIELESERTRK